MELLIQFVIFVVGLVVLIVLLDKRSRASPSQQQPEARVQHKITELEKGLRASPSQQQSEAQAQSEITEEGNVVTVDETETAQGDPAGLIQLLKPGRHGCMGVVGESHYQPELRALRRELKEEIGDYDPDYDELEFTATLVRTGQPTRSECRESLRTRRGNPRLPQQDRGERKIKEICNHRPTQVRGRASRWHAGEAKDWGGPRMGCCAGQAGRGEAAAKEAGEKKTGDRHGSDHKAARRARHRVVPRPARSPPWAGVRGSTRASRPWPYNCQRTALA